MTTINLAIKRHEDVQKLDRVRRIAYSVTTTALVVYIVVTAGFLGWWWYTSFQRGRANEELEGLLNQVTAMSQQEAVARRLASKAASVTSYLDSRWEMGSEAQFYSTAVLMPVAWDYDGAEGVASLTVNAGQAAQIDEFVNSLAPRYTRVRLMSINWTPETGWVGTVAVGGKK